MENRAYPEIPEGTKWVVVDARNHSMLEAKEVLTLSNNDKTRNPYFKKENGVVVDCYWRRLAPAEPAEPAETTFENARVGDRVWWAETGWGTIDNNCIGETYPVKVALDNGRHCSFTHDGACYTMGNQTLFWDEVKIVAPPRPQPKAIEVVLGERCTATVGKDTIKVGCQEFSFDAVERLFEAVKKMRGV